MGRSARASSGATCPGDAEVAVLLDGAASGVALAHALEHAATCDACRELLAAIGRVRAWSRPADRDEAEPGTGAVLGRYRLGAEIGRGGMGIVYEAHDPELDRRVAIKVLHRERPAALARLSREARAVARLSHLNVVQIFDVDASGDQAFIVMEFVEGRTLRDFVRETRPSWRRILAVYRDAGRGLAAAHAAGLVHRDFKPTNAIIDTAGRVKVLDFGLARPHDETHRTDSGEGLQQITAATATATGMVVGTPSYMAPEQHRGDRVDARADIYAFGVALFEALHGRLPFEARTADLLLRAKARGPGAVPRSPEIPDAIDAAITKALAYEPADRWGSMHELLDALKRGHRGRSPTRWVLAGLGAVGLTAAFVVPEAGRSSDTPAPHARVDLAPDLDPDLEGEARALVERSRSLRVAREAPAALGTAWAASSIAVASGSAAAKAEAELQIGESLFDVGEYELAAAQLRDGIEHAADAGEDAAAARGAALLVSALGVLDRVDEALEAGRLARSLAARAGDDGDLLADILVNEASMLPDSRDAEAIERFERALAMRRSDPALADPRKLAAVLHDLGSTLRYHDHRRARALLDEALEINRSILGPNDRDTLSTELMLVTLDANEGDLEGCVANGGSIWERLDPGETRLRATAAEVVAQCCLMLPAVEDGLVWVKRALDVPDALAAEAHPQRLRVVSLEGMLLWERGDLDGAEARLQHVLALRERHDRRPSRDVAEIQFLLGGVVRDKGDLERSEAYARSAVDELEATREGDGILRMRVGLAEVLLRRERFADVLDTLEGHLDVAVDAPVPVDPTLFTHAEGLYAAARRELERDRR